jgi:hypothetical protein
MLLLTGIVLSDRYYLIVVVENLHKSCALIGHDIEQEVSTYPLSEPLPLSFSPARLYACVTQRCQTPLGVPHLLMQVLHDLDCHRPGGIGNHGCDRQLRQLADGGATNLATDLDADAIADQVIAAPLNASRTGGEPLTCYICAGSHTVAMCPMFKKIIASPHATSVVLGNLRAASSSRDQSAATLRRRNTSLSHSPSTPRPLSCSTPATNIFHLGSADATDDTGIDADNNDSVSMTDDTIPSSDFC